MLNSTVVLISVWSRIIEEDYRNPHLFDNQERGGHLKVLNGSQWRPACPVHALRLAASYIAGILYYANRTRKRDSFLWILAAVVKRAEGSSTDLPGFRQFSGGQGFHLLGCSSALFLSGQSRFKCRPGQYQHLGEASLELACL